MTWLELIASLLDIPTIQKYVLKAFRLEWFCFEHNTVTLQRPSAEITTYVCVGNTISDAYYCLRHGCRQIVYLSPEESINRDNYPKVELNNMNAASSM